MCPASQGDDTWHETLDPLTQDCASFGSQQLLCLSVCADLTQRAAYILGVDDRIENYSVPKASTHEATRALACMAAQPPQTTTQVKTTRGTEANP